jgi:hypothetical protein
LNLFADFALSRNISQLNIYIRITLHISFKTMTTKQSHFHRFEWKQQFKIQIFIYSTQHDYHKFILSLSPHNFQIAKRWCGYD